MESLHWYWSENERVIYLKKSTSEIIAHILGNLFLIHDSNWVNAKVVPHFCKYFEMFSLASNTTRLHG